MSMAWKIRLYYAYMYAPSYMDKMDTTTPITPVLIQLSDRHRCDTLLCQPILEDVYPNYKARFFVWKLHYIHTHIIDSTFDCTNTVSGKLTDNAKPPNVSVVIDAYANA